MQLQILGIDSYPRLYAFAPWLHGEFGDDVNGVGFIVEPQLDLQRPSYTECTNIELGFQHNLNYVRYIQMNKSQNQWCCFRRNLEIFEASNSVQY